VSKVHDNGPPGTIEFRNCTVDGTEAYGIKVQDKSADAARVKFIGCTVRNAANNRAYHDIWAPIGLSARNNKRVKRFGGIDFLDCRLEDARNRPALIAVEGGEIFDVTGSISVKAPHATKSHVGDNQHGVTLKLIDSHD
jgi:hypothetical protein